MTESELQPEMLREESVGKWICLVSDNEILMSEDSNTAAGTFLELSMKSSDSPPLLSKPSFFFPVSESWTKHLFPCSRKQIFYRKTEIFDLMKVDLCLFTFSTCRKTSLCVWCEGTITIIIRLSNCDMNIRARYEESVRNRADAEGLKQPPLQR